MSSLRHRNTRPNGHIRTTTRAKVVSYIWHPKMPNRDVGTHLKNLCYAAMIPMLANDSKCCGDTLMFMASCIRGAPQFGVKDILTCFPVRNHYFYFENCLRIYL
ncbi:hypothetical protein LguiA_002018 [Lonicera macranthoides]